MKDIIAKIISNHNITKNYFKMAFAAPLIAKKASPGQFVEIKCNESYEPLLRRPFSIHRVTGSKLQATNIEILYEVIGKGTELLSKKKPGECINILGPLGNGFTLPLPTPNSELRTILIAGGIGAAPLIFLAEKLREIKNKKARSKIIVLIGARTKNLIICDEDFKKLGAEIHIATDDGSIGHKGFVTDLLEKHLTGVFINTCQVYACGPLPMLKKVHEISSKYKIQCQVSMEEKMSCGFGVCLGCAIKTKNNNYKLVCKDGPVFDANDLIWDQYE